MAWLSEVGALHPGGTVAFQLGKILSGSSPLAFRTRRTASAAARLGKKKKSKQILQRGGEHFELTLGDTQRTANRGEPACREKRQQRQARQGSVPKIRASTRGARSVLDMGAAACSAQTGGNGGVMGFISEPTCSRDVNGDKTWLRETRVLQRFQIF